MNSKKKIYISLAILGIITSVLIVFVIFPLLEAIKKNSEDFVSQKGELVLLKIKSAYLRDFEKVYKTRKPNLEKINTLFVNPEVPIDFIAFLEETAEDSQVLITISPMISKKTETDLWSSIAFQISLTGAFSDFSKFLERIETSPWLIEVLDLDIGRAEENAVSVTFLMKAYTQ